MEPRFGLLTILRASQYLLVREQYWKDGASVHTNVVNGLEIVATYTTQADASLKAVYKTAGGTTLKEELTTYDAAGAPTVTAKEFLGADHTRVTVSDAETQPRL